MAMMSGTVAGTAVGLIITILIFTLGCTSVVLMTVFFFRQLRGRGVGGGWLVLATIAIGWVAFWGAWLVFDCVWAAAAVFRSVRRRGGRSSSRHDGR
jgi:hypothetical protein